MKTLLALLLTCPLLLSAETLPAFDVASIHPSEPGGRYANFSTKPGELKVQNVNLRSCIEWAYDIKPMQLNGPDWLNSEKFDIVAHAADRAAEDDTLRLMFQSLLAERFGLKIHRDRKEQPVFHLVTGKNGPKFHDASAKDASKFLKSTTEGATSFREDPTGAIVDRATMPEVANKISTLLNRVVIDKTGLKGRFDLRIDLLPYMNEPTENKEGPKVDTMSVILAGFNEQLGLKFEPAREVIETVVVDAINKTPTGN